MTVLKRLCSVDWTASEISERARRVGPIGAGIFAALGSLVGTASGVGGAIGAGIGGGVGALAGYAYAGLTAGPAETRNDGTA